jgi:hypothetical protein
MTTTDHTSTNLNSTIAYAGTDLSRTDQKAAALLALDGLLVAALSFLGTDLHGLALILAIVGAVALVAGVVLAVLVIRPRLTGRGLQDRASYVYYATADPAAITEALAEDRRIARLQALSRLALRKMRVLQLAGDTTLVAVFTIAAAVFAR